MIWSLVTSPDERERCCAVIDGERCTRPTEFRVESADGALDDYAYVCADHVQLVNGPNMHTTSCASTARVA